MRRSDPGVSGVDDWIARLAEARGDQERQAAAFAAREVSLAAREAVLVARLEQRGRVIDELTAHLSDLAASRVDDLQALDDARRSLRAAHARLNTLRRAARALALRAGVGRVRDPSKARPFRVLTVRKPVRRRRLTAPPPASRTAAPAPTPSPRSKTTKTLVPNTVSGANRCGLVGVIMGWKRRDSRAR